MPDRFGRGHIVRGVHQHHRFGKGLPRADDFEDLLLAVRGQTVDFHRAGDHEVERLGRLTLAEQRLALVDAQQLAVAHQFVELLVVQRLEQVVAAQDLVVDAVKHHGDSSSSGKGARTRRF
ncbi:hypothetical protein D3C76_1231660 [compost metagenome]